MNQKIVVIRKVYPYGENLPGTKLNFQKFINWLLMLLLAGVVALGSLRGITFCQFLFEMAFALAATFRLIAIHTQVFCYVLLV